MKYLLTILFINLANEPVMLSGWHPLEIESQEQCAIAKKNVEEYIDMLIADNAIKYINGYTVTCSPKNN
jgi:hypothetical protein